MGESTSLGAQRDYAPYADWTQLARPSRSSGLEITHYIAGSSELIDVAVPNFCVSLGRLAPSRFEVREEGGRWRSPPTGLGHVSCMPPGSEVSVRWDGRADAINLQVRPDWLDGQGGNARPFSIERPSFCLYDRLTVEMIEEVYRDNLSSSPFGTAYTETLAIAVLHRIGAIDMRREAKNLAGQADRSVDLALDYIQSNLDADLSLSEIAAAANASPHLSSFVRAFRHRCGQPPHQYIIEQRLERAKAMLQKSQVTVTEIALACGFSSLSHFSGAFKRRWGLSPTAFSRKKDGVRMPQEPSEHCWRKRQVAPLCKTPKHT